MSRDERPRLTVVCIVETMEGLILGQRSRGAHAGCWVLPGGGVEFGEHWRAAGEREVREETGLRVEIRDAVPAHVMEIVGDRSHRVCLVSRAILIGSIRDLRPSDEFSEVRPFARARLTEVRTTTPVRRCLEALGILTR